MNWPNVARRRRRLLGSVGVVLLLTAAPVGVPRVRASLYEHREIIVRTLRAIDSRLPRIVQNVAGTRAVLGQPVVAQAMRCGAPIAATPV